MKSDLLAICVFVLCSGLIQTLHAVPPLINYQGYLTGSSGAALDTSVAVTFRLYGDSTSGAYLWSENHPSVPVQGGLLDARLGEYTALPDAIINQPLLYLGLQVGSDAEMTPRARVLSVAYSYRTGTVDGATGGVLQGDISVGRNQTRTGTWSFVWGDSNQVNGGYSGVGGRHNRINQDGSFIGGGQNNVTVGTSNTIVVGESNHVAGNFGSILGGDSNSCEGDGSVIVGGRGNQTNNLRQFLGGGLHNNADGSVNFIGGGESNHASGDHSCIVGGQNNLTQLPHSFVGGGIANITDGTSNTIVAGESNHTSGSFSSIVGGNLNSARGNYATIGGGQYNQASGIYSTISGGGGPFITDSNTARGDYSTLSGGRQNRSDTTYTFVGGGFGNRAVGYGAVVSGGQYNFARGGFATISGGGSATLADSNSASGSTSVIGGGYLNTASGTTSVVSGGINNLASNTGSTVGGGGSNVAAGYFASISGGLSQRASGDYAFAGGGSYNYARGSYSVVMGGGGSGGSADSNSARGIASVIPGGQHNETTGIFSLAAGYRAKAVHNGAFVWADSTPSNFSSSAANQFNVRASGGVRLFTNSTATLGAQLAVNATAWTTLSDSTTKRNIRRVNTGDVLAKVTALPISQWSYKAADPSVEHIGPMAQDFWKLFHLGEDSLGISTIDPDGITLAAIQELAKRTNQIDDLKRQVAQLQAQVQSLIANQEQSMSSYKKGD